jgi:hypothetical protein
MLGSGKITLMIAESGALGREKIALAISIDQIANSNMKSLQNLTILSCVDWIRRFSELYAIVCVVSLTNQWEAVQFKQPFAVELLVLTGLLISTLALQFIARFFAKQKLPGIQS